MAMTRLQARRLLALTTAAAAALAPLLPHSSALGAAKNYTGQTDNTWDNAANWSTSGKPAAADDALFPLTVPATGRFVLLSTGETANSLTFNNSYNLQGGDLTLTTGNVTVDPGPLGPTIDNAAFGSAVASSLLGTAGLNKLGAGTLFTTGTNTYTGTASITAGKLGIVNDTNLGAITTIGGPRPASTPSRSTAARCSSTEAPPTPARGSSRSTATSRSAPAAGRSTSPSTPAPGSKPPTPSPAPAPSPRPGSGSSSCSTATPSPAPSS